MKKRRSQSEHEQMIRMFAEILRKRNYRDVRADLPRCIRPTKVPFVSPDPGQVPDLTAEAGQFNIFEVETADSIMHPHTAEQWITFAKFAQRNHALFWVVVPPGSEKLARERLKELKIKAVVCEMKEMDRLGEYTA